jgi:hypothetical protein
MTRDELREKLRRYGNHGADELSQGRLGKLLRDHALPGHRALERGMKESHEIRVKLEDELLDIFEGTRPIEMA